MDSHLPIGLNPQAAQELAKGLNDLLADLQVCSQNVRGFRWNLRGPDVLAMRQAFEAMHTELYAMVDEVAERIRTLDARPLQGFDEVLNTTDVPAVKDVSDGAEAMRHCVAAFSVLLVRERALIQMAQQSHDDGSAVMLGRFIAAHEKQVWLGRVSLG
jgi:starvation-inducible DNA-binding protein